MIAPSGLDQVIVWSLRVGLALLCGAAAWHKWTDPERFHAALAAYGLLPSVAVRPVSLALPFCEASLAAGLLVPAAAEGAALGVAALLSLYTLSIAINLARGRRDISCGCLGDGGPMLRPALLARNAVLLIAAACAAAPMTLRAWLWIDAFTVGVSVFAFALLYLGIDVVLAQGPLLARLRGEEVRT